MKVMYISHRFKENVCATIHLDALREIVPPTNLYVVDLGSSDIEKGNEHHIIYGRMRPAEKISRALHLTSFYLTPKRIESIIKYVQKLEIDCIFIDESIWGKLVKRIKKSCANTKVIVFYHDIAQYLYPYWLKTKGIKFLNETIAGMLGEWINQKYADVNLVLNGREVEVFEHFYGRKPEGILTMAVESPNFEATVAAEYTFEDAENRNYILFVGSLYQPNIDGLEWFVKNVFCKLDNNYYLVVIGRGLDRLAPKYKQYPNVDIVGGVESLAPYYNNANIVVAPIFDGGGMKQKTAEAFAYGKAFIGTTESLHGYEVALEIEEKGNRLVYCANTPEEQIQAINCLIELKNERMHHQLFELYRSTYSKEAVINTLRHWGII
jgi:hypothetical protein